MSRKIIAVLAATLSAATIGVTTFGGIAAAAGSGSGSQPVPTPHVTVDGVFGCC
jgi:hypothetical protein